MDFKIPRQSNISHIEVSINAILEQKLPPNNFGMRFDKYMSDNPKEFDKDVDLFLFGKVK
jgi:hypothetical protein